MNRTLAIIRQAGRTVGAYKLRTFFCLISVALGVSSIAVIVAATEGAYKLAYEMVDRFGPDSLLVVSGSQESRALGERVKTIKLSPVNIG